MISAIEYSHSVADLLHRDITPENILIDENDNIKISDFGLSYIMKEANDDQTKLTSSHFF